MNDRSSKKCFPSYYVPGYLEDTDSFKDRNKEAVAEFSRCLNNHQELARLLWELDGLHDQEGLIIVSANVCINSMSPLVEHFKPSDYDWEGCHEWLKERYIRLARLLQPLIRQYQRGAL